MHKKLNPCPECGGNIELYSICNPGISYSAFARCEKCKKEYPIQKVMITGALQTCQIYPEWVDTFVKRKKDRKKWASYLRLAGKECCWSPSVGAICRVITANKCLHDNTR